jgi:hypothetical protein
VKNAHPEPKLFRFRKRLWRNDYYKKDVFAYPFFLLVGKIIIFTYNKGKRYQHFLGFLFFLHLKSSLGFFFNFDSIIITRYECENLGYNVTFFLLNVSNI